MPNVLLIVKEQDTQTPPEHVMEAFREAIHDPDTIIVAVDKSSDDLRPKVLGPNKPNLRVVYESASDSR